MKCVVACFTATVHVTHHIINLSLQCMLRMDLVSACETISFIDSLDFTVDSDYLLAVDSVTLGPRWLKLWHQAHSFTVRLTWWGNWVIEKY